MTFVRRHVLILLAFAAVLAVGVLAAATAARAAHGRGARAAGRLAAVPPLPYVPGRVIVSYTAAPSPGVRASIARRMGVRIPEAGASGLPQASAPAAANEQVLKLPAGVSVSSAVSRLRGQRGVAYAVPDYVAHAAGAWIPNDRGRTNVPGGWQRTQWNFLAGAGVNAPTGWSHLLTVRRGGASGVTIAILDTGVAYRNWKSFSSSPDFGRTRFVWPRDFVAGNVYPLDRDGHGTLVAGLIAESTNNGYGLTGLAYAASIMPVRVLGTDGSGDSPTIARGIRYAVDHGAQIINLSLEFSVDPPTQAADIPDVISALHYAQRKNVLVVAAAGNDLANTIAYPARTPGVVSVGATTKDKCLAWYSNDGPGLSLVAPGGDDDASLNQSSCHPGRTLPDITQITLLDASNLRRFGYPSGWYGTSMSSPEVAAAAAMVIASGVIGRHPSPAQILSRLEATAHPLGGARPNPTYGYGLIDVGAATAPIIHAPVKR